MKIISWNVNGIRAVVKNGFKKFLETEKPDVLCLQEVKISDSAREKHEFDFSGYSEYWHSAERPGYSGTAILVKENLPQPSLKNGIGIEKFDSEGRIQTAEFERFYLINCYFPNTRGDLSRLDFKLEFDEAILKYVKKLQHPSAGSGQVKPVILTGDLNVAHEEIDLKHPKANDGQAGFHPLERKWLTKFLEAGFIDTFRELYPTKIQYSWWSYRFNARKNNAGWRIDYFVASKNLKNKIIDSQILDKVVGSDHCPIILEIKEI